MHGLRIIDFTGLDPDDNVMIEGEAIETLAAIGNHADMHIAFSATSRWRIWIRRTTRGGVTSTILDKVDPLSWNTHLKELLAHVSLSTDDGSVWLQLNDSEQHRARLALDEVFGPENFVATIIWQ